MTDDQIKDFIREEVAKYFTASAVSVNGVNISLEAMLKSNRYKGALSTNTKYSHEQRVEWAKTGGRGNKKGRLKKE